MMRIIALDSHSAISFRTAIDGNKFHHCRRHLCNEFLTCRINRPKGNARRNCWNAKSTSRNLNTYEYCSMLNWSIHRDNAKGARQTISRHCEGRQTPNRLRLTYDARSRNVPIHAWPSSPTDHARCLLWLSAGLSVISVHSVSPCVYSFRGSTSCHVTIPPSRHSYSLSLLQILTSVSCTSLFITCIVFCLIYFRLCLAK